MTATVQDGDEAPLTVPDKRTRAVPNWHIWALGGICLLATALYAWRITSEGWGNPYYAAAVKSMAQSLTDFVFGSFDPVGLVTVDKPPLAFWAMVASTAVFGYHGWSVLLPQVLEGVAAVFLLHRAVRRWAGENAALLAALVLALTPITVAIDRDSNPDTMMVLLLVAASYAFTRSVEQESASTRWLMLAAAFLGLGFVAKMLQAWIVVPAFVLAYLAGCSAPWWRRSARVLGAGAVMLISSMWWVVLVGVWPAPKPYIGGSADGSVLNLVIGYNGLGRILGSGAGQTVAGAAHPGGGQGGHHGGGMMGGQAGITRMFSDQVGGQISWLLPLCLVVLAAVAGIAVRRKRSGQPADLMGDAGWVLWGGWLLVVFVVLSYMQNMFHPYYTTEMAPGIAAVTGAGLPLLWKIYRRPGGLGWLLLPAAVAITAGWAWVVISREPAWNGWARYAVAFVALGAVAALVIGRQAGSPRAVRRVAGVLAVIALLLGPGVWSAGTAFASSPGGPMAQAGPSGGIFRGHGFQQRLQRGDMGKNPAMQAMASQLAHGHMPPQMRSMMSGSLSHEQGSILNYATSHSGSAPIKLAVEGGARSTEAFLIHDDATVIGMGGFSGGIRSRRWRSCSSGFRPGRSDSFFWPSTAVWVAPTDPMLQPRAGGAAVPPRHRGSSGFSEGAGLSQQPPTVAPRSPRTPRPSAVLRRSTSAENDRIALE